MAGPKVVFLGAAYPPEMLQYTRGLAEVGATVYGVGDTPAHELPRATREHLSDYLQVPRLLDRDDVLTRVHSWLRGREVDLVLANWEVLVETAAALRVRLGLPGMRPDTVRGFRDKQIMKERVRAAGLRTPKSRRARTVAEVKAAAAELGYPMIIKPVDGAGSADTYRVDSDAELDAALARQRHVPEVSCEEFVTGEEYTFDTVCVGGVPLYENVARYLPPPLEARSQEWISPVIITVRDLSQPHLQPGIALGRDVIRALGMGDGFTHMEWFRTATGEAVFGEIGCRPGGAHLVDQMNYTSDIDLFVEWARACCYGRVEIANARRYNAAIIFKRAKGRGRITRITGLVDFMRECGEHVVEEKLLRPGQHRRNWKQTLTSDGHIMLRHADWDTTVALARRVAEDIHLYAE